MYAPIKIIIADDHELFRDGFKLLLKKQNDIELAAEAADGKELLELTAKHNPDVIITDIQMPVMDGIQATRLIKEKHPHIGVIALTMFSEESLLVEMLEAGAKGYLLKNTNKEELLKATKTVFDGGVYFCKNTSLKLANIIGKNKFTTFEFTSTEVKFTGRELEVINLICKEYSNKEMAAELGISIRTIESYKENIQQKIGAKNVVGIAVYAVRHKLCDS